MDWGKLKTLKDMVMTAESLGDPWNYFFDHFGENPEFMRLGKRVKKAPLLTMLLSNVGERIFGSPVKPKRMALTSLPQQNFVHGACFMQGYMTSVIYFSDVKIGLVSVSMPEARPHNVKFARFSATVVERREGDEEPILAPVPPTRGVVN